MMYSCSASSWFSRSIFSRYSLFFSTLSCSSCGQRREGESQQRLTGLEQQGGGERHESRWIHAGGGGRVGTIAGGCMQAGWGWAWQQLHACMQVKGWHDSGRMRACREATRVLNGVPPPLPTCFLSLLTMYSCSASSRFSRSTFSLASWSVCVRQGGGGDRRHSVRPGHLTSLPPPSAAAGHGEAGTPDLPTPPPQQHHQGMARLVPLTSLPPPPPTHPSSSSRAWRGPPTFSSFFCSVFVRNSSSSSTCFSVE